MSIEMTTLKLTCEQPLRLQDARLLRGFFGQRYRNRPEFHHHGLEGLVYRHPLIQYKTIGGVARVVGLGTGSFLLRAIDPPEVLSLNGKPVKVLEAQRATERIDFGPVSRLVRYRFLTPWLALNAENYRAYRRLKDQEQRCELLNKILIGNLLSLCKSVELGVTEWLEAQVHIGNTQEVEIKKGVLLIGIRGTFNVNFQLPEMWGIGKQSARGFGTVHRIEE